jgi:hypothetical protein
MTAATRSLGMCLLISVGLAACGGGDESGDEAPVVVDYSALKMADSRETPLVYAQSDEQVLLPLRNGMRLAAWNGPGVELPAGTVEPAVGSPPPHSDTTVQVEGVDEADSVEYDGQYIYAVRREHMPA